jgi:hypothetical protein
MPKQVQSAAEPGNIETKTPQQPAQEQPAQNLPAQVNGAEVAVVSDIDDSMYATDAGRGMEGATAESFAIPFLIVLQKGSPQVDEASGAALPGARQGMLFNTVTGQMHDPKPDKDGPLKFVPCTYKRTFIRWGARGTGGGSFKGEYTEAQIADMRAKGEIVELDRKLFIPNPDGSVDPKKNDRIADTRNHYGLILTKDGAYQHAMISLTSTQIKKSKTLMAALASVKKIHPMTKQLFQPPTFANIVDVGSQPEQNELGNWMGITFATSGEVRRADIYNAAKAFAESVRKGAVQENYQNLAENAPAMDDEANGGNGAPSHSEPKKF